MASESDSQQRARPHDADDSEYTDVAEPPSAETRKRVDSAIGLADDVLDDIDAAMRANLNIEKDASDEVFEALARAWVLAMEQKGGE